MQLQPSPGVRSSLIRGSGLSVTDDPRGHLAATAMDDQMGGLPIAGLSSDFATVVAWSADHLVVSWSAMVRHRVGPAPDRDRGGILRRRRAASRVPR